MCFEQGKGILRFGYETAEGSYFPVCSLMHLNPIHPAVVAPLDSNQSEITLACLRRFIIYRSPPLIFSHHFKLNAGCFCLSNSISAMLGCSHGSWSITTRGQQQHFLVHLDARLTDWIAGRQIKCYNSSGTDQNRSQAVVVRLPGPKQRCRDSEHQ